MSRPIFATSAALLMVSSLLAQQPDPALRDDALKALRSAVAFYHGKAARHGGYVYYSTPDMKERWGEGKASDTTVFVQPPGTPTVGMAFLAAHAATGEDAFLTAARDTAEALVSGQLQSGGWTQTVEFGPARRVGKYRNGKGGSWNSSSLDDGQTQAALQFLMRADQALGFKNKMIHDAVEYGLAALLKAQFPNGAFPQVWTGPVDAKKPVAKAKYPEYDWKTEGKVKEYWGLYTLNDGLAGSVADTLILAHEIYKDDRYKAALAKLGDFLVLAQMPDPQPGWCQQYTFDMAPAWARKFEPPAITGWESQDAMVTLIKIARHTGQKRYLDPIPPALAYFTKRLLPDGRLARFYELKTDKPLYMDAEYRLTHDDSTAPTHYGWKQPSRLKQIDAAYQDAKAGVVPKAKAAVDAAEVRRIIRELDADGRWVSTYRGEPLVGQPKFADGFRYVSSAAFSRNVETLSAYLSATKK